MNRFITFLIGMICGGVVAATVYSSHIVQTEETWLIVPRVGVNVKDIYADVRHWGMEDWKAHPELSRDMVKAGHAEILRTQATERLTDDILDRVSERLEPTDLDFDSDSIPK